jgi:histone H3/H4
MAAASGSQATGNLEEAADALGLDPEVALDVLSDMQRDFEANAEDIKADFLSTDVEGDAAGAQPIPLARVRRLVKCDGTVTCNLASEMLNVLSRATQLVVMDLSARSAWFTHKRQRRVVHGSDVVSAVDSDRCYDFLADVVGSLPGAHEATPAMLPAAASSSARTAAHGTPSAESGPATASSSSSSSSAVEVARAAAAGAVRRLSVPGSSSRRSGSSAAAQQSLAALEGGHGAGDGVYDAESGQMLP